ncbi:hypothetical protein J2S49_000909 [Arcanobacterium wilhelmae]|uniref:DUF4175 domain-containing protein n=1 Tax=Arcanobacterium wilhelmae TaxID=1803177 RepID=A0ABT9NAV2_9ACTO|nr:hypothetical protein [Arcanobacterium wilhelmae]MDP9800833.1 hypothetical protein [Arcanobacterium wilhelmae]WFN90207.1 hypothetical protein P8A24_08485 [Arcanobacterium wilhelmae]
MADFFERDRAGKWAWVGWAFFAYGAVMTFILAWFALAWQLLALTAAGPLAVWAVCMLVAWRLRRRARK